jgi:hypothetical protein
MLKGGAMQLVGVFVSGLRVRSRIEAADLIRPPYNKPDKGQLFAADNRPPEREVGWV